MSDALHFLLVEDDGVEPSRLRRAVAAVLPEVPVDVAPGDLALDMLQSGRVPWRSALVIIDLGQTHVGGLAFLRSLRASPELCATKVVAIDCAAEPAARDRAWELHVAGVLDCPEDDAAMQILVERVHRYFSACRSA